MTLHMFFRITILIAIAFATTLDQTSAAPTRALVCFGSYSTPDKESVHLFQLNLQDGSLKKLNAVDGLSNPSFLKIHPNGKYLYTVNEVSTFDGKKSGGVTAFALDVNGGKLNKINQQPSGDTGPCHLTVDATGKYVLVAHYSGGSTSVLPIKKDGSVGAVVSQIKHKGSSVHSRQKAPHAHAVHVGPNNKFAFAPDLGIDKVLVFSFDENTGAIAETKFDGAKLEPGSGPRHFDFHPDGKFAYVINEIKQTVTAFRYNAKRGRLRTLQTLSTVPHPVDGNSTAEVLVHPTGQFLLAANQQSDNVTVFRINQETGKLKFTGNEIKLSKPVCVRMILQN